MDARREFTIRLGAKGTTVVVVAGSLLGLGSLEPPDAPHHADDQRPFIGLPPAFDIGGGTAMQPEEIIEKVYPHASGAVGPGQRFNGGSTRFVGVSMPDPPLSDE